jgi:hypothetical protein
MALYSAGSADPFKKADRNRMDDALVSGDFAA